MEALRTAVAGLLVGESLSTAEARRCFQEIMEGQVSDVLLAGFLSALRMKGETPEEIAAFASVMREGAISVPTCHRELLDTCGTGGDGLGTFNVSTLAALVAAGAGAVVAKHGNRAVSSRCGSADLLSRLGVDVAASPERVGRCLDQEGIGFLFAPSLHPAMKRAAMVRRELGFRTVFNLLGPLSHPAQATYQMMGVFSVQWVEPLARALRALGTRRAMVVHGLDSMDEITTTAPTLVAELNKGRIHSYEIDPVNYGISRSRAEDLLGGDVDANAAIAQAVLAGEPGPKRDLVLINAAAALWVCGVAGNLREGVALAAKSIDSGQAAAKLEALVQWTADSRESRRA